MTIDDLFQAALFGNDKKINFILECNTTDINAIDSEGKTPMYLAAENDNEDVDDNRDCNDDNRPSEKEL